MGQSIAAMSPAGETLSVEAAIANSAWAQMNDPETLAGQIYENAAAAKEAYVQTLLDANVILVVAAGNSGGRILDADPGASRNLLVSDSMIAVGASNGQGTETLDDDTLAYFSSDGADFVAEGEGFVFRGEVLDGTSFSAPQVSGMIARIAEDNPHLSATELLAILLDPANRDGLFENIEGTELDGFGIIKEDGLESVFANQPAP
jgi:subtilisin family serine protease